MLGKCLQESVGKEGCRKEGDEKKVYLFLYHIYLLVLYAELRVAYNKRETNPSKQKKYQCKQV